MAVVAIKAVSGLRYPCDVTGCRTNADSDLADLGQIRFRHVYCDQHFKEAKLGRLMSVPDRQEPAERATITVNVR